MMNQNQTSGKIRIVLADDQKLIRQGLAYIINAQHDMCIVGEAENGSQAVDVSIATQPDVILMDVQMPEQTGIVATRQVLQQLPEVRVIILTTFDVQEYVYDGIRAGAVGYLLKDTDADELLDGIRAVLRGEAFYRTPAAAKALAKALSDHANERENIAATVHQQTDMTVAANAWNLVDPLTEREVDVLQQMAYGLRNEQIADKLCISQGTVKTHVHRILQKLGVDDRTHAVVVAIRHGIVR